jgi:acyl dehydratase
MGRGVATGGSPVIDRAIIGREWPAWDVEIERGRLTLFAKAIGETRAIYTDDAAARAAGYRGQLAPPTFAFCLQADGPVGSGYLTDVGIPITDVLHGEQSFTFHAMMCAGDRVRVTRRVVDVYEKKGGALEFVVFESEVRFVESGALVALGRQVMIWRHR